MLSKSEDGRSTLKRDSKFAERNNGNMAIRVLSIGFREFDKDRSPSLTGFIHDYHKGVRGREPIPAIDSETPLCENDTEFVSSPTLICTIGIPCAIKINHSRHEEQSRTALLPLRKTRPAEI